MRKNIQFYLKAIVLVAAVTPQVGRAQSSTEKVELLKPLQVQADSATKESGLSSVLIGTKKSKWIEIQAADRKSLQSLKDLKSFDASLSENYSASGYYDLLSVRGVNLDVRGSYLREGLPIHGETHTPLENKESVQIIKGLSGAHSGTVAPGGVVNYQVVRAFAGHRRSLEFGSLFFDAYRTGQSLKVDFNAPIDSQERHYFRSIVSAQKLHGGYQNGEGTKYLGAVSTLSKISTQSVFETELEWVQKSQATQPGWSLWGNKLPSPVDPQVNINNQSWSQPVVFEGLTGSLRWTQSLDDSSSWQLTLGRQDLKTDDYLTYPYGCSAENNYDRYCSDSTFDVYDYRSEKEKRYVDAGRVQYQKYLTGETLTQTFTAALVASRFQEHYQYQANNSVGTGRSDGKFDVPSNATASDNTTNREFANQEIQGAYQLDFDEWKMVYGFRAVQVYRHSHRLDGSRKVAYVQNFVLPWLEIGRTHSFARWALQYNEGSESYVTPNKNSYNNPGAVLPAVKSRQWEFVYQPSQLSHDFKSLQWTAFYLERGAVTDSSPQYQVDGVQEYKGLEFEGAYQKDKIQLGWSTIWQEALRKKSRLVTASNDKRLVNLPELSVRLQGDYELQKEAQIFVRWLSDSSRRLLPTSSQEIPAWTRWDVGLAGSFSSNQVWKYSAIVENLFDQRFWRESPYQYGHIYLYPEMGRRLSVNIQTNF